MNVWNFVSGYVKICIMGKYPEGLLNRAALAGISVWDISSDKNGSIFCAVSVKGLKRLRHIALGSGCRIRIVSKHGLCRRLLKLRYEPLLMILSLLAIAFIIAASKRVWFIRIDCGDIDEAAVSSALSSVGVERGVPAAELRTEDIISALAVIPGAARVQAERHGVVLSVCVSEDNGDFAVGGDTSSSYAVYAAKDCVIIDITVLSGRALVSAGDRVKAGQQIISGDLSDLKEGYTVPAVGEAYGKVLYCASAYAEQTTEVQKRTGASASAVTASLFGSEYMLRPAYSDYELEPEKLAVIDACFIPITLKRCIVWQTELSFEAIDEAEAIKIAEYKALAKLYSSVPGDAKIVSLDTENTISPDGRTAVTAYAVVIEKISS